MGINTVAEIHKVYKGKMGHLTFLLPKKHQYHSGTEGVVIMCQVADLNVRSKQIVSCKNPIGIPLISQCLHCIPEGLQGVIDRNITPKREILMVILYF